MLTNVFFCFICYMDGCYFFFVLLVLFVCCYYFFFFSSRRRHTRLVSDWSSDVCSSDLEPTVRYMTLTWNNGNDWAGSSTDPERHGGLTSFGHQVVERMNQLGMLVDVSHVSDATFRDVLATSTRPVIASHSSCRALAHHPRNLSDEQLRAIARNGGVVGINFYPVFLDEHFRNQYEEMRRRLKPQTDSIRAHHRGRPGESAFEVDKFVGQHAESLDVPTIDRLLDHIDHAVQVMGIDHVGLGSDFDGISVLPRPMKDATSLPELVRALEARGYSDSDVRKILGENFLRVLTAGP